MEDLTKNEERIMQIIWELKSAFVNDVIDKLPDDPKPPYSTVSSVVRILEKKGFLGFKTYGKTYEYYPLISKDDYGKRSFRKLLANYFDGSSHSLLSFMVQEEKLTEQDIASLQNLINKK